MNRQLFYLICTAGLLLMSVSSFAQADTTEKKSSSPLLDKYYPRPKAEKPQPVTVQKTTGTPLAKPATPPPAPKVVEKKVEVPAPVQTAVAVNPTVTPKKDSVAVQPVENREEPPVITSTPILKNEIKAETPMVQTISDSTKIAAKPLVTATAAPAPKTAPAKPEGGFKRPRLGSSSPLYDTYEKNANGAGSVTTLPKR